MNFRYFDAAGRQLTPEQLQSLRLLTPAMDHVFATVAERLGKPGNPGRPVENESQG
ncbi:MAG: hypothetical protein HFG02_11040 [Oscillibacter sp.]|nr:hypothetical protein [Oscillibacter sp.]